MNTFRSRSLSAPVTAFCLIALITLLQFAGPVVRAADDDKDLDARKADAKELLKSMHLEQMVNDTIGKLEAAVDRMSEGASRSAPDRAALQQKMHDEAREMLRKDLNWESMEPEFVQAYADAFTDLELKDLNTFYASPVGQKYVGKQSELSSHVMQIAQGKARAVMARVTAHIRELSQAAKAAANPSPGASTSPEAGNPPPDVPPPAARTLPMPARPGPPPGAAQQSTPAETPSASSAVHSPGKGEPGPD